MNDKPTIAVLGGTGNEGPGLATRWAHNGYKVIIGSRQEEKAQATADELNEKIGIDTVTGMQNDAAARAADICVLTVVATAHEPALKGLADALQGKILVDATARLSFPKLTPPAPPSAARLAQDILGDGVTVVAAFQNVPASALKKSLDDSLDTDVLVCADDEEAADKVVALAEGGGMRAFYAGGLDNAITVEGITSLLIKMNKRYGGHGTIQVVGLKK